MHHESAPSVHSRIHVFKVYCFVSRFPTMVLNRAKLKYRVVKLKAFEKFIWMIGFGVIYLVRLKGFFLVHLESTR